jgi:hypothetical protein
VPCPPAPPAVVDELLEELLVPDPPDPVVVEPAVVDVEPVTPALPLVLPDFGTEFVSPSAHAPKHAPKTPIANAPKANHFPPRPSLIMTSRKRRAFPFARHARN